MPKLSQQEINSLILSLERFDEQRIRDAIELARDPELAAQLVAWLKATIADKEDIEWCDRLSTATVALILGEAGAAGLLPVLMDRVVNNLLEFTDELFEYVLRRMGEPMIREAIRRLPDVERPLGRAELYHLMDSAHLLSPAIQREVADFCFARVPIELELPADRKGNTSWYPCCRLLVTLADSRVGGIPVSNSNGPMLPSPSAAAPDPKPVDRIGRNAPCPCGSGKKYKKCCGA